MYISVFKGATIDVCRYKISSDVYLQDVTTLPFRNQTLSALMFRIRHLDKMLIPQRTNVPPHHRNRPAKIENLSTRYDIWTTFRHNVQAF